MTACCEPALLVPAGRREGGRAAAARERPAGGSGGVRPGNASAGIVPVALLFATLLWTFWLAARSAVQAIPFPAGLDYGEGIVWEQMRRIVTGTGYGPIDGFPTIVFHYPPLYHLVTAACAAISGVDPLAAGRGVSFAATLAGAGMAGLLAAHAAPAGIGRGERLTGAAAAALLPFVFVPVLRWELLMRVDMLAGAFSLAGLLCAVRALERPRWVHAAAIAFVCALYTKQTAIAAPAAAFLCLLVMRPRMAVHGIATALATGGAALALLCWLTDGGFARHVFLYNVNRFEPDRLWAIRDMIAVHSMIVVAAAAGLAVGVQGIGAGRWARWRGASAADPHAAAFTMLSVYLLFKILMLPMIGKSGAAENYFLEWMFATAIFAGLGVGAAAARVTARGPAAAGRVPALLLILLLAAQVTVLPKPDFAMVGAGPRLAAAAALTARIRAARAPVISDDMVLLMRAGQPVVWEPSIFAELASTGFYDERPMVARIRAGRIGFFVTEGRRGDRAFDSRYTPAIADAMDAAYPREQALGGLTVHLPAGGWPATVAGAAAAAR